MNKGYSILLGYYYILVNTTFIDQKLSKNMATNPRPKADKHNGLTTCECPENKRILVVELVELEPKKKDVLKYCCK